MRENKNWFLNNEILYFSFAISGDINHDITKIDNKVELIKQPGK